MLLGEVCLLPGRCACFPGGRCMLPGGMHAFWVAGACFPGGVCASHRGVHASRGHACFQGEVCHTLTGKQHCSTPNTL